MTFTYTEGLLCRDRDRNLSTISISSHVSYKLAQGAADSRWEISRRGQPRARHGHVVVMASSPWFIELSMVVFSASACCNIPEAGCIKTCYNSTAQLGGNETMEVQSTSFKMAERLGFTLSGFVGSVLILSALFNCVMQLKEYRARAAKRTEALKARERAAAAMDRRKFVPPQADDLDECPICLAEFEDGQSIATLRFCRHTYHEHCIMTWLSVDQRTTCPLCKSDVHMYLDASKTLPAPTTEHTTYSSPSSSARV